jgi:hypothetical protein
MMPTQQPSTPDIANPRTSIVATIVLIMLAVMIIMDVFERWRSAARSR